ncbi:MAG: hypothetical protein HFF17_07815 [Oscillospiraceae bacterium]|nr:hypothetical protein [Oscillospiraceae bacterium]
MNEAVRNYLISVVSIALLSGVVLALTPEGAVHRTLKFLCGLAVILAAIGPVARLDFDAMAQSLARVRVSAEAAAGEIEADSTELIADIIKEKTEAYIWDKADTLGMELAHVTAEVRCDGTYPYPYRVTIAGTFTPEQRSRMTRALEQELAVPEERQEWHTDEAQ